MTLEPPPAQDLVLIGATGDLSQRKLLPGLYNLALDGLLPSTGRIIGYARTAMSDEEFRDLAAKSVHTHSRRPFDERTWDAFAPRLTYVAGENGGMATLAERCRERRRLVYLATPPSVFPFYVRALADVGLVDGTQLVIEKPFGRDLESALALDRELHDHFNEEQIFRIDHYLGKETVQNIIVFRFGNALFERVWNRDAIDHVQITVAETLGMEGRGQFYEEVGALRDIVQNHMFQVLSLLTMEPPAAYRPEAIRDEKAKLLESIPALDPSAVVRGQYVTGAINGVRVPGYREEPDVAPDSATETFVALRLNIDNWRWAGVPFYLRTGKRLARGVTEVSVVFREVPIRFFGDVIEQGHLRPNHLTLRIQPGEAITFSFLAKEPGPEIEIEPVRMSFSYRDAFEDISQDAYERLLHEAMDGDRTLFLRSDAVEEAWRILDPVLQRMPPITFYAAGSWGPPEADAFIAPREWHLH